MPVRFIVSPEQFLFEMLGMERPKASDLAVIARDPLAGLTDQMYQQTQQINMVLRQRGLSPMRLESLSMLVEYSEEGQRYREQVQTTIADSRGSAFMWSNDNTLMLRAPAADFDRWLPVLDKIRNSRQFNPQWVAAVESANHAHTQQATQSLAMQQQHSAMSSQAANAATGNYAAQIAYQIHQGRQIVLQQQQQINDNYWKYESDNSQ
jgi:hypothetical protein